MAKAKPIKKASASGVKKKAKSASSKSARSKSARSKSGMWTRLAGELKTLIPKLDEEGLAFLVKQSQIHLYNMQVDALNQTLIQDEKRNKLAVSRSKTRTVKSGFSEIKKAGTGSAYYIVYGNESIIFNREEMETLVKIVYSDGTDLEVRERLYNWLSRERSDLTNCAGIADKFDDGLKVLVRLLKGTFKLKKR